MLKKIIVSLLFFTAGNFAYHAVYYPVDEEIYHWYRLAQMDSFFFEKHKMSTHYFTYPDLIDSNTLEKSNIHSFYKRMLKRKDHSLPYNIFFKFKPALSGEINDAVSDSAYASLRTEAVLELKISSRLSFFSRYYLDTKGLNKSAYPGHKWEAVGGELAGMNDVCLFIYRHPRWGEFLLGKQPLYWGHPETGALMISYNAPPAWTAQYQKNWKRARFTYVSQKLNNMYPTKKLEERINRYYSAHRLDLILPKGFQVSLSESVLYGGPERNPEPGYVSPLSIFFLEQFTNVYHFDTRYSEDDNLFLNFEVFWKVKPNLQFYVDWFIDDFQYDMVSEPNEIGYTVGVEHIGGKSWSHGFWRVEFTRVNNWVYGQNRVWNRYLNYNSCIGHWMGPDGYVARIEFERPLGNRFYSSFKLTYGKKGEGSIFTERGSVVEETDFPSGVVEEKMMFSGSLAYRKDYFSCFKLRAYYERINNYFHSQGKKEKTFYLGVYYEKSLSANRIVKDALNWINKK